MFPSSAPLLRHEDVAAALSDVRARRLLGACLLAARPVKELSREAELPLATTYRYLHRLVACGLLVVERSAMTADGKRYELYRSRIRNARIDLDASGERVAWEPNEAIEARLTLREPVAA